MQKTETQKVTGKVMMELSEQEAKLIKIIRGVNTDKIEVYIERSVIKWAGKLQKVNL